MRSYTIAIMLAADKILLESAKRYLSHQGLGPTAHSAKGLDHYMRTRLLSSGLTALLPPIAAFATALALRSARRGNASTGSDHVCSYTHVHLMCPCGS